MKTTNDKMDLFGPPKVSDMKTSKKKTRKKKKQSFCYELLRGSCLNRMKKMADNSVDIIVTSPPYNLDISYSKYKDKLPYDKYLAWMEDIAKEVVKVLKDDGSLFLNMGFSNVEPWVAWDVANVFRKFLRLQNQIAWVKSISIREESYGHFKPINSPRFLNNNFEYIFHFTKYNNVKVDRLSIGVPYADKSNIKRWKGKKDKRCAGNVWYVPYQTIQSKKEKGQHPAIFPLELAERCILLHGVEKGTKVLDIFCGTGTTLVAAKKCHVKHAIGMDIDRKYLTVAKERLGKENE